MKIGIYGGSFDPLHLGHLNLAAEIMEAHALDQVWFCPAACNPHKNCHNLVSAEYRLKMIRLAIENEPRFFVSEIEINRKGLSYTIETLNELIALQSGKENPDSFALILGEDSARSFHQWHQPEAIIECAQLLIGRRNSGEGVSKAFEGSPTIVEAINRGLTQTRVMEISSHEIRTRLLNKKYCYHLVPGKVLDYINTNGLYSIELNESARFL